MTETRPIIMLAFPGFQILDVTGPLQMFAAANDELGAAAYEIAVAAPESGLCASSSGMRLCADFAYGDLGNDRLAATDTLIAAGGTAEAVRAALCDRRVKAILAAGRKRVRRIASVCSGAFLLAEAGLLDGRRATTHWQSAVLLQRHYPKIRVDADAIHIADGAVWTSAGVTAGIDLALAMIEADHGRDIALALARRHVVYRIRPGGQSQFSAELAGQSASEPRIARLAEKVLEHPEALWTVERLAEEAGLSVRSLSRLFQKQLQMSPAGFVERARVDAARRALLESGEPIDGIALDCGFGSPRRMHRAFTRLLSVSPSEFRNLFKANGGPACRSSISVSSSFPGSPSST